MNLINTSDWDAAVCWLKEQDIPDSERELYLGVLDVIWTDLSVPSQDERLKKAKDLFQKLISTLHPDASVIANLLAIRFVRLAADPITPLPTLCSYFDILYGLYWCGAQRLADMQPFDSKAVFPFAEFLRHVGVAPHSPKILPQFDTPLRIGYFCHYAHNDKGNAVAPLIKSLAITHQSRSDRQVFLYCVQWSNEQFVSEFVGTGVTVRNIPQQSAYDRLDELVDCVRRDQIDVLITDIASAISTYVFCRRAAPLQMWIDMGYPFWSIDELDWVLLPGKNHQSYFGIRADRFSYLRLRQASQTLSAPADLEAIEATRSSLPKNRFLMATFARQIKMTSQYLRVVRRLLREIPESHFLLAGDGTSSVVDALRTDPQFAGRITVIPGMVNLNVYGRIIDVLLDTFPFIGGLACREVGIHGKPVVSMLAGDWDRLILEERDPALIAQNEDEYCARVVQLAKDRMFYGECAKRATALGALYTSMDETIEDVESGITLATEKLRGAPLREEGWFKRTFRIKPPG